MALIEINKVVPGMILEKPVSVYSKGAKELLQKGLVLEEKHIKKLKQWDIKSVYIETGEDEERWQLSEQNTIQELSDEAYSISKDCIEDVFNSIYSNEKVKSSSLEQSVNRLFEVITINKDVLMLLAQLKKSEKYLFEHCVDVCVNSLVVGKYLKVQKEELIDLGIAAICHDISLPNFNRANWDFDPFSTPNGEIKNHPIISGELLERVEGVSKRTVRIVREHHEFLDGSGFPYGLSSGQIDSLSFPLIISEIYLMYTSPINEENQVLPHQALKKIFSQKNKVSSEVMKAFLSNVAMYPIGSMVQLSSGEIGKIIGSSPHKPFRPQIKILYNYDHSQVTKPYIIDLSSKKYSSTYIEREILNL